MPDIMLFGRLGGHTGAAGLAGLATIMPPASLRDGGTSVASVGAFAANMRAPRALAGAA